ARSLRIILQKRSLGPRMGRVSTWLGSARRAGFSDFRGRGNSGGSKTLIVLCFGGLWVGSCWRGRLRTLGSMSIEEFPGGKKHEGQCEDGQGGDCYPWPSKTNAGGGSTGADLWGTGGKIFAHRLQ